MLISDFEFEVIPSHHHEGEYDGVAHLKVDLGPVLPFLNAVLARAIYMPETPALSWQQEGHKVGFWPDRIAMDHFHTPEEAREKLDGIISLVNDTWERRSEIKPLHTRREFRQPLGLLKFLPGTNCKACGEASCFQFALQLATGRVEADRCTPLFEEGVEKARKDLLRELNEKSPTIPPSGKSTEKETS